LLRRMADDDFALLRIRMIRVVEDPGERIAKDRRRLLKVDTVFREVGRSLRRGRW